MKWEVWRQSVYLEREQQTGRSRSCRSKIGASSEENQHLPTAFEELGFGIELSDLRVRHSIMLLYKYMYRDVE